MTKMTPDIGIDVIEYTFDRLPVESKLRVIDKLQRKTRQQRWNTIVNKIRQRAIKNPVAEEEITSLCEEVRQKLYEQRTKNRR